MKSNSLALLVAITMLLLSPIAAQNIDFSHVIEQWNGAIWSGDRTPASRLAHSKCGTIAVLAGHDEPKFIRMFEPDGSFWDIPLPDSVNFHNPSAVFFEDTCNPSVIIPGPPSDEMLISRYDGNEWHTESLGRQCGALYKGVTVKIDDAGKVHYLAVFNRFEDAETCPDTAQGIFFLYGTNRSGVWTREIIAEGLIEGEFFPRYGDPGYSLAIGPTGVAHVAYVRQECYSYQQLCLRTSIIYTTNQTGQWVEEVVTAGTDNSSERWGASIALYPNGGGPAIAATRIEAVPTLSITFAHLIFCQRQQDGSWTEHTIINSADGYCGADGCQFTGIAPDLFIDHTTRPTIFFLDWACTHDNGQFCLQGNLRYTTFVSNQWVHGRVFPQGPYDLDKKVWRTYDVWPVMSTGGGEFAIAFTEIVYDILNQRTDTYLRLLKGTVPFGEGWFPRDEPCRLIAADFSAQLPPGTVDPIVNLDTAHWRAVSLPLFFDQPTMGTSNGGLFIHVENDSTRGAYGVWEANPIGPLPPGIYRLKIRTTPFGVNPPGIDPPQPRFRLSTTDGLVNFFQSYQPKGDPASNRPFPQNVDILFEIREETELILSLELLDFLEQTTTGGFLINEVNLLRLQSGEDCPPRWFELRNNSTGYLNALENLNSDWWESFAIPQHFDAPTFSFDGGLRAFLQADSAPRGAYGYFESKPFGPLPSGILKLEVTLEPEGNIPVGADPPQQRFRITSHDGLVNYFTAYQAKADPELGRPFPQTISILFQSDGSQRKIALELLDFLDTVQTGGFKVTGIKLWRLVTG